ncbi:uncharacterized protein [Taeniopygia guttata]|uniref:uncharacterized protein n=1 Tax=Taeniopygia guttata TaxID=59729 RepID=UPI003BB93BCF
MYTPFTIKQIRRDHLRVPRRIKGERLFPPRAKSRFIAAWLGRQKPKRLQRAELEFVRAAWPIRGQGGALRSWLRAKRGGVWSRGAAAGTCGSCSDSSSGGGGGSAAAAIAGQFEAAAIAWGSGGGCGADASGGGCSSQEPGGRESHGSTQEPGGRKSLRQHAEARQEKKHRASPTRTIIWCLGTYGRTNLDGTHLRPEGVDTQAYPRPQDLECWFLQLLYLRWCPACMSPLKPIYHLHFSPPILLLGRYLLLMGH